MEDYGLEIDDPVQIVGELLPLDQSLTVPHVEEVLGVPVRVNDLLEGLGADPGENGRFLHRNGVLQINGNSVFFLRIIHRSPFFNRSIHKAGTESHPAAGKSVNPWVSDPQRRSCPK